jgi:kynureninase
VAGLLNQELQRWARLGVDGHFHGEGPWYTIQERLQPAMARLVGARPDDVVLMNGLTVNLHLLFASFFRPTHKRFAVIVEHPAFPSDLYAVQSQHRWHGLNPQASLLRIQPRPGEDLIEEAAIERLLEEHGQQVAIIWLNAVNFLTGQFFDVPRVAVAARKHGCLIGLDLAHAVGNVPLALHDWGIDFAVWCTYKYLCGGPGSIAGVFVHERHARNLDLPRLAGWWGNDPKKRFQMHLEPEFTPAEGAAGWQVSNPSILALSPVGAALELFDEAGMDALRQKSLRMTGYLAFLIEELRASGLEMITPREPERRGCQLSLRIQSDGKKLLNRLAAHGVVADFRPPDVLRVAPAPLYNTFQEVWIFARLLERVL